MKKILLSICALAFFSFTKAQEFEKNQLIIKVKPEAFQVNKVDLSHQKLGVETIDVQNQNNRVKSITPIGDFKVTYTFLLQFEKEIDVIEEAKHYSSNVQIQFAEPNFIAHGSGIQGTKQVENFPNDTFFLNRQWSLYNTGNFNVSGMTTTADADVDMELAWDIETGDPNMIIAVADSGLNLTHEDIANRVWTKPAEIIDGIDNDGNGLIDDYRGWDWANGDNDPTDDHGHGTNCTGIIGSIANNGKGYAGVNWNSKIMPLKVLDANNSASYASMANSLYYAANNGAKIVSMSIGGTGTSIAMTDAVNYLRNQNVLLVACMMNFNNEVSYYPAAYSTTYDNVIAVGSTDANDKRTQPFFWDPASGSNYGNHINVVAPGNFIYGLGIDSNTSYGYYWGGTSQATPLVAGVASLILARNPSLTPAQVRTILQTTAEDRKGLPSEDIAGFDKYHGWGRINAHQALLSPTLATSNNTISNQLKVVNPVNKNQIEIINESSLKGNTIVTITDFDGRLISKKNIELEKGKNIIPASQLESGSYILGVENKDYKKIFKILVK